MTPRVVLLLAAVGVVAGTLAGSRALVLAVLAAALLVDFTLYARAHLFDHLGYERRLSRTVVPWGAEIELTTAVTNQKWLPVVWLHVVDAWPTAVEPLNLTLRPAPALGRHVFDQTLFVRWYQRVRRHYRGRCSERGVHAFGPVRMEASDPLGLGGVTSRDEGVQRVTVLPKVLRVAAVELLHGRPLVGVPTERSLARDPASPVGVRAYSPGDPLRAVNWRATARTGLLHTNVWEPTTLAEVRILLNVRSRERPYEGVDVEAVELLCVTAASCAAALAEAGFAVGLHSNARLHRDWRRLEIEPGSGTLPEILEALARVLAYPPPPFEDVLLRELDDDRAACDYLIVTPALHDGVVALIARLGERHAVHTILAGDAPAGDGAAGAVGLVDARVPGDFDWRNRGDLALA